MMSGSCSRETKIANKFVGITKLLDAQLISDDLSNDLPDFLLRPTSFLSQLIRLLRDCYGHKISHSYWKKDPPPPKTKVW